MEKVLSIYELENMIKAIKDNNKRYVKRCPKYATGVFLLNEWELIQHRDIESREFKTINY